MHNGGMPLSVATALFLLVALVVAIGIVVLVALPNLRGGRSDGSAEPGSRKHRSRTRRD